MDGGSVRRPTQPARSERVEPSCASSTASLGPDRRRRQRAFDDAHGRHRRSAAGPPRHAGQTRSARSSVIQVRRAGDGRWRTAGRQDEVRAGSYGIPRPACPDRERRDRWGRERLGAALAVGVAIALAYLTLAGRKAALRRIGQNAAGSSRTLSLQALTSRRSLVRHTRLADQPDGVRSAPRGGRFTGSYCRATSRIETAQREPGDCPQAGPLIPLKGFVDGEAPCKVTNQAAGTGQSRRKRTCAS